MNRQEQKKSSGLLTNEGEAKDTGIVEEAKHAASNVAGQARQQVSRQMGVRKDRAVEKIGDIADAFKDTQEKLKEMGPLGEVAGRAADGLQRAAAFLEGRNVKDIVREVESF